MTPQETIPYGTCQCGCGRTVSIAKRDRESSGHRKGEPVRYVLGHQKRLSPVDYIIENRSLSTPCWTWQLGLSPDGYSRCRCEGKTRNAHIVFYEEKYGKVPVGLDLDHLCRNRACVNPDHLEPATRRDNVLRGMGPSLTRSRTKTQCANGHVFDEANTYLRNRRNGTSKDCRTCNRERARMRKKRAKVG